MFRDRSTQRRANFGACIDTLEDRRLMSGALPTIYSTHSSATSATKMHASQGVVSAPPSSVAAPGSVLSLESNGPTIPINPFGRK